ncbi:sigma 54-interacting transcriptional regulator [Sporosarcina pasteurii]|uniref:Propionate catabolism operon regulatory protein n=1 Tax=Sporosarcina pasteurii TaxID=1474 RepID=A0A380BLH8_SPOPA|nr:sigma 54-interacting transcriptional regulator [Sporosarcina pasteurii]MDS9470920.1 sigma 54-interacting transcriptional regulator [Sporosarcina pasteurii]QBQ05423.1 AAA family ATPase [Sporosarcina pasteurii]SUJ03289.1 Propionate catabolism operon regulatory protein [Sporosarcina pasteurii]
MYPRIAISGSGQFSLLAANVLKKLSLPDWIEVEIVESPMEHLLNSDETVSKEMFDQSTIIISGGQSAEFLEQKLDNMVIPVKVSYVESLIQLAKEKQHDEIAIINYKAKLEDIDVLSKYFNFKISQFSFDTLEELIKIFKDLRQKGISKIIGGSFASKVAEEYDVESLFFYKEAALRESIEMAVKYLTIYRNEMEQSALFRTVVRISKSGVISVDQDYRITSVSTSAEKLLGINKDQFLNHFIGDCIEELHLPSEEIDEKSVVFNWKGIKLVANRSPVYIEKEKVGEIFVIDDVNKIQEQELDIRRMINKKSLQSQYEFIDIIGSSERLKQAKEIAKKFSKVNSPVLIQGESGTGKELFAQSIHHSSKRSQAPFVAVNCAALPESLLDSELFGYEEGAFTGANKGGKKGLFEIADKGTIFLDEISELPIHLQSRLLRVLQEKEVMRIGGNKVISVDIRVIVATNKDLMRLIQEQKFREDLYYRISVLQLSVPPLRERREDIEEIARDYFRQLNINEERLLTSSSLRLLNDYSFPGNIRELKNILERFQVYSTGEELNEETLKKLMQQAIAPTSIFEQPRPETLNLEENEKNLIKAALIKHSNNKGKAAEELGISRATLWRKLKE